MSKVHEYKQSNRTLESQTGTSSQRIWLLQFKACDFDLVGYSIPGGNNWESDFRSKQTTARRPVLSLEFCHYLTKKLEPDSCNVCRVSIVKERIGITNTVSMQVAEPIKK